MRDIAHGILHGLVVAAILLTAASWAPAQTPAPYAITNADPLVIELEAGATSGTVAFLENVTPHSFGRTSGTLAGFDFHCTSDGGQGYTGLVWWNGLPGGGTYRAAIELPAGRLSAPEDYSGMPWDWSRVQVFDVPIGSAAPCAIKVDVTLEDGHALRDTSRAFVGTSGGARPGAGDRGLPAAADIREDGRPVGAAVQLHVDAFALAERPVPYCERLAEPNLGLSVPQLEGVRTARKRCELAERTQGHLLRPLASAHLRGGRRQDRGAAGRCPTPASSRLATTRSSTTRWATRTLTGP